MRLPHHQVQHLAATIFVALSATAMFSHDGQAQWAPNTTVRIVVPFPAGGTADLLARLVAQQVSRVKAQTVIIENRPGGGTVTATESVARAAPDGTTVLLMANSFLINSHLRSLSYDPLTSFEPVCALVYQPLVLAVNHRSPMKSITDFLAATKEVPPSMSVAAVGPNTALHLALEMLKRSASIDFNYVPFPGGAPAVTALVGSHVSSALATYSEIQEHVGTLRPLVVGSPERLVGLKDVPTLSEAGFGDVIGTAWFGFVVPAKTDRQVVRQMAQIFKAALQDSDVKSKLASAGFVTMGVCEAEFEHYLKEQHAQYARTIREAKMGSGAQ